MNKKNRILILIDLQYTFKSSNNKRLLRNCIKIIKLYKKYNLPIILVKYKLPDYIKNGDIEYEINLHILQVLGNYSKLIIIEKDRDDGSIELIPYINNKICHIGGVNTAACVASTAYNLALKTNNKIIIDLSICNQQDIPNKIKPIIKRVYKNGSLIKLPKNLKIVTKYD